MSTYRQRRRRIPGRRLFFVTHSLGSYLSLAALDSDLVGPQGPEVPQLKVTSDEKNAADYFAAHTASFYFLRKPMNWNSPPLVRPAKPPAIRAPTRHRGRRRRPGNRRRGLDRALAVLASALSAAPRCSSARPTDYRLERPERPTSWDVPDIEGVRVVNIRVRNSGFKIPPFLVCAYQCAC